jgi:Cu-Zn family superoxide dismutase
MHMGPMGGGHLGDLPLIMVGADGTAKSTLTAPRIKTLDPLRGHALMIHVGGDNYSDQPAPLGGGGARMACGIIAG